MEVLPDPEWLNESFLVHALQSVEKNNVKVKLGSWSSAPAVPAGSNYLSQLYRVTVNYNVEHEVSKRSITLIVKVPFTSGATKEFLDSVKGYEREVKMYQDVLPAMYEVHSCRLTAQSFDCSLDNFLVLKDLKVKGYMMVDRLKQLDKAHCRQSLMALARFHALSVAVHHRQPDLIEEIGLDLCNPDNKSMHSKIVKLNLSALNLTVEKLDGCKQYSEMIHKQIDSFPDKLNNILESKDGLMVLGHGDAWLNNILFKYSDNGEVTDSKLVDFQTCRYCSFALDVIFFWFSSANENVRKRNREELFEVYRKTLNQTLEETACVERLSKEEFDSQMRKNAPYALQVISTLLTAVMADPDNLVDFSNFNEEDLDIPLTEDLEILQNFRSKYYMSILPVVLHQVKAFGAFS